MARKQNRNIKGSGGLTDFIVSNIIPSLAKSVGINSSSIPFDKIKSIISKSLKLVEDGSRKWPTHLLKNYPFDRKWVPNEYLHQ